MTLVELLRGYAVSSPEYTPFVFLEDGEDAAVSLTAGELDTRARAIACALLARVKPGDRALLVFAPGLDFIAAFFGCLYAGVIAVPAYPPDPRRLARTLPRITAIARGAGARTVLTTRAIAALAPPELGSTIAVDDARDADAWQPPAIDAGDVAMLQFTSGSTAVPRGVVLSHACLLANLAAIRAAFELEGRPPRTVSWLPPYHDMGLIGTILASLYSGGTSVLMSPLHFLQQPVRWLRAITKYRGDVSGGPNFAYDLCVRKVDPARHALDLSSWAIAFNGAEVVRADTLARFADTFAAAGFARRAFLPCYGLAEATLIATGVPRDAEPTVIDGRVGSGRACAGVELAIVEPETCRALPDGETGEIWLAGPSVGHGYWDLPDDTARVFGARIAGAPERGPFLRTGDLGHTHAGELFVSGRIKDVIIVNGRNVFPDELERVAVAAHPALRPGCTAAFAAEIDDRERLVIAQELDAAAVDAADAIGAIRRALAVAFDLVPHDVLLVPPGTIPKTSSGKVQRHACRAGYADGSLVAARCAASRAIVG